MTVAGTAVTAATIEADLRTLQSDDRNRDGQLGRQGIQADQFPTATFVITSPIELGSIPADGQEIEVTATGQLTLHGQTKDVEVPMKARLSGDVIAVSGSIPILFADYGIEKPESFKVLSVDDNGIMEFQVFFSRA
jgi:polyisoprenoid-binding protein YceI